jgi:hypothetical protein
MAQEQDQQSREDGVAEGPGRRKISTRHLAAGSVAVGVAGVTMAAFPGLAFGLLGNRHQFIPSNSNPSAASHTCVPAGAPRHGPARNPSKMSAYADPGAYCGTGGRSGFGAAAVNACSGGCQEGLMLGNTRGAAVTTGAQNVARGQSAYDGCSIRSKSTSGNHLLECVSRRSFGTY